MNHNLRVLLLLFPMLLGGVKGLASQQGPNGPGTSTTSGSTSYNWSNPSNATFDNTSAATASIVGAGNMTNTLRLTNFGFSIPGGATINGILVEIRMQGPNGKTQDQTIQLRKSTGSVGTNKARRNSAWPKKNPRFIRFGGSSDLWGTTWTSTELNNTAFGIDIVAKSRNGTASPRVEYVRVTVTYNQTLYYSKSTGDLHTLATWGTNTNGTGTAPSNFTADGQVFNLRNRTTAALTGNLTISGAGSKLVTGDGTNAINLTIPATFVYSGLVDVSNNATLTINHLTVPTFGTISRASNGGASTVIFGASGNQSVDGRAFHNLTISGSGTKTLTGTAGAEGKLTIGSGSTFSDGGYIYTVDGNIENSGTHQSLTDGVIIMNGTASQSLLGTAGVYGHLEIDNTTGVILTTSTTVSGTLYLTSGPLSIGANTLNLSGNTLVTNGTLTGGSGSNLNITGTGSLGILSFTSGAQTVNTFTLNRTSGDVTLGTPLTINTTLTMTSGNIVNGANALTLGTSTSSRGTLNRTSGIITGSFTRWFANATNTGTTGLFPIGTSTEYRPARINFTSAPGTGGTLTVQFVEGHPGTTGLPLSESGGTIDRIGVNGVWSIVASALTGGLYTADFTATNFTGVDDYTKLHLLYRTNSGANWALNGTHQTTTGSNAIPVLQRTGVAGSGEYGVGGDKTDNSLPVELLYFKILQHVNVLKLIWSTASELDNDYFELEQSLNGRDWLSLARVKGNGTSDIQHDYMVEIQSPHVGTYYRLTQFDFDGQMERLGTLYFDREELHAESALRLYPNPASAGSDVCFKDHRAGEIPASVMLRSMRGGIIRVIDQNKGGCFVLPELLPAGVYLVSGSVGGQSVSSKLVVK
ncbi:T9SS type A sorting domain-containing protein [Marinoscillum sp.]|uniref:T9SS type A sorting domain-containing protein n=1 Tax=Marinoscillum sp. TaxID=2024838 RepID=UPI003BA8BD9C